MTYGSIAALGLIAAIAAAPAKAQDKQAMIASALSAAPPAVAASATVMTMAGEVLQQGTGPYTCFPYEGPGTSPMCLDPEWMRWANAWMTKSDYQPQAMGLAYMLAGDMPEGGASNIDPFATAATPDNHWVVEGPHVMILPADAAALDALSDDYTTGEPYVMWRGTPYAHIMMPTGPRP